MKILGAFLTLLVMSIIFSSNSVPDVSYANAYANAWSNTNRVYLSASGGAAGIEVGGYAMSCTGKPTLASRFVGSTSPYLGSELKPKRPGESQASIGGRGYDGVGYQDYDDAEAE